MTAAYIGLGGNEGDRLANLERAVDLISEHTTVTRVSPLYETEPVGYAAQPWFLNAVIEIETSLPPRELLEALQQIENALGKATPFPNGPRTIDLDILFYGDTIIDEPGFRIPHAHLHERAFVLRPLADIAPSLVHPTLGKSVATLLAELPDTEAVRPAETHSRVFATP